MVHEVSVNILTLPALIMGALNPVHTAAKTTPLILMSTKLNPRQPRDKETPVKRQTTTSAQTTPPPFPNETIHLDMRYCVSPNVTIHLGMHYVCLSMWSPIGVWPKGHPPPESMLDCFH